MYDPIRKKLRALYRKTLSHYYNSEPGSEDAAQYELALRIFYIELTYSF